MHPFGHAPFWLSQETHMNHMNHMKFGQVGKRSLRAFLVPSDVAVIVVTIAISIFALRINLWRRVCSENTQDLKLSSLPHLHRHPPPPRPSSSCLILCTNSAFTLHYCANHCRELECRRSFS